MGASMRRGDLKRESIHGSRKEGRHRPARQASEFARGGCYICRRGERHRGRFVWVKRGVPHDVRGIRLFPDGRHGARDARSPRSRPDRRVPRYRSEPSASPGPSENLLGKGQRDFYLREGRRLKSPPTRASIAWNFAPLSPTTAGTAIPAFRLDV